MAEFVEVMKKKNEMCECYENCANCPLSRENNSHTMLCDNLMSSHPQEAEEIIMTWIHPVDWENVEVDTPILVRYNENDKWENRHFAKYENNKVCAWIDGKTSWSANNIGYYSHWGYAKLAEEGEE